MKRPNVLMIAVDTLRADHLGCYGYTRPTSPAIDALAAESIVFERAFAAGIPTMPAFTTIYSGLHPYRHGIVAHAGQRRLSEQILLLPQLAQAHGYTTIACDNLVVQGEGRGSWFARGYDHYSGFLYRPHSDQSTQLTNRALQFIDEFRDDPLFMFIHYWDPHTPYRPRPPYDTMHYQPGSGPIDLADVIAIAPEYYTAFLKDMHLQHPDDYAYVVAQYDGELSITDAEVGRLIAGLKERGIWEDTIIVLLADHGEAFGEGDLYFDHHGLYDAVTRIALMLRVPGSLPGRVGALVSSEDVLPTLLELLSIPGPAYQLTGASLVPLLYGKAGGHRYVVTSESTRQASLALRTPEWKLIEPITSDLAGRPLFDVYGRQRLPDPLLFDICADPGERHNLAQTHPHVLAILQAQLAEWRTMMSAATGEPDPIRTQGLSLPYQRFMQRLLARG